MDGDAEKTIEPRVISVRNMRTDEEGAVRALAGRAFSPLASISFPRSPDSTFHSSWPVGRYPACSNKPRASAAVTADSAAPIASTKATLLLAAALLSRFLILANAPSMGL
jgi:hypothetical protein